MWLQEFLPQDVKNIRIMSYGYNTNLIGDTADDRILDYRRELIQQLENARSSAEVRLASDSDPVQQTANLGGALCIMC